MKQRMTAWVAPHGLNLSIVGLAVIVLGGCAEAGGDASQDADPGADPSTSQDVVQDQAAGECWVRGDPADLADRSSPLDSAEVTLDAGTIKVCYNRPQRRDRTVFGELVPFGEPWRLGANEATAIYIPAPASIADIAVEPGWYSLYAVPGEDEWQLVVNAEAQRWGIQIDDDVRARDVGSTVIPVEPIEAPVEMLTMTLQRTSPTEATLTTEWEETRVSVPIQMR